MLARLGQAFLVTKAAEVNLMLTPTDDLTPEQRAQRAALECLVNLDMEPELAASKANRDNHKAQTARLPGPEVI